MKEGSNKGTEDLWPKDQLLKMTDDAYRTYDKQIAGFEREREEKKKQADEARKAGNKALEEQLLNRADACTKAIEHGIGFAMQENLGLAHHKIGPSPKKGKEEEKRRKKT